jgi:hypothetical protein
MALPTDVASLLASLSYELPFGVPKEAVPFARLRVRGLRRDDVVRLVRNDQGRSFTSFEAVLDASPNDFIGIINPSLVVPLQDAIVRASEESYRRRFSGLLVRARQLSTCEAHIRALYESQGTALDNAVEHLLNAEEIQLGAVRVTRQRRGEIDLFIPVPEGGSIMISATASEDGRRGISWNKSREVLGALGAPAPIRNFVVVGKPDFQQQAQQNADELVTQEGRTLLLLRADILGDLCMRIFEHTLDREALLDVLWNEKGYMTDKRVRELFPDTP